MSPPSLDSLHTLIKELEENPFPALTSSQIEDQAPLKAIYTIYQRAILELIKTCSYFQLCQQKIVHLNEREQEEEQYNLKELLEGGPSRPATPIQRVIKQRTEKKLVEIHSLLQKEKQIILDQEREIETLLKRGTVFRRFSEEPLFILLFQAGKRDLLNEKEGI